MSKSVADARKPWNKPTIRPIPMHPALANHPALLEATKAQFVNQKIGQSGDGSTATKSGVRLDSNPPRVGRTPRKPLRRLV